MTNTQLNHRISEYRSEINQRLQKLPIPAVPESLYQPMMYSLSAPGKRIRPILTLLTAEGFGIVPERAMSAALAVEVLHTFTLVHDDIMDNDTQRRGRSTVHVKWDDNTAILAGDGLMALAFRLLMETNVGRVQQMGFEFSQAMLEICEGQALDMEFEKRLDVSTADYLEMVSRKTGRLLGLACQLGALIASVDDSVAADLNRFGIEIGQAFQIQDDLLELISDQENMGKSLDSDIAAGKKTYPLVLALTETDPEDRQTFMGFLKTNINDRGKIVERFEDLGIIEDTRDKIDLLFGKAQRHLSRLPERVVKNLEFVVQMISKRQR
jgi:geranylgeranyl diphosphate synthase type II